MSSFFINQFKLRIMRKSFKPGSLGDKMIKGAAGSTAGIASGTMLSTIGQFCNNN